jgi:D-alanine--poly(phosphoribitol) ligase subunit 2
MDTAERIGSIFRESMGIEIPSSDSDIIAAGLLDSLAFVTLLVEIEQQLDITIPLEAIDIERLRTLNAIVSFVDEIASGANDRRPPEVPYP